MSSGESESVSLRLEQVRGRIAAAAASAGRPAGEVTLVAVTKTVGVSRIREAVEAGQKVFGENRVQEAREKVAALGTGFSWHLVGHLQKNKARYAVELFDTVESLDSEALARELDRRAGAAGRKIRVLVQVKEAEEENKAGLLPEAAPALIEKVGVLLNLELAGLMVLPPWPEKAEDSRPFFSRLRELREQWDGRYCPPGTLRELSMGMTVDFEVAVEEGATIVRIGSALFGPRPE